MSQSLKGLMKGLQELRPKTASTVASLPLKQAQSSQVFCLYLLQCRFKAICDGQSTFKWKHKL